jgi:hypothetical protein
MSAMRMSFEAKLKVFLHTVRTIWKIVEVILKSVLRQSYVGAQYYEQMYSTMPDRTR